MSPDESRRIGDLEKTVAQLCTLVDTDLKQTHARLRKMEAFVYGNPEAGVPGIVVDLDRVKGTTARMSKLQWLVSSLIVAAIVERLLAIL